MENDNLSVASGASTNSTNQEHVPCPHCNSDFQKRSLFRHIRTKHHEDFIESCAETYLKTAKPGRPLKVFYEYTNDFGDKDYMIFYACLSSNKTFQQEGRGIAFFKKNPKALKEHNAALKELQDEYAQKEKFDPYKSKLERMKKTNNPDFCRKLWSGILHLQKVIQPMKNLLPSLHPDLTTTSKMFMKYQTMTFKESIVFIQETEDDINKLRQEECLQYKPLETLYYRLQRILAIREDMPYPIPSLWPKCGTNADGFETPTDEWGFGSPEWEQVDF